MTTRSVWQLHGPARMPAQEQSILSRATLCIWCLDCGLISLWFTIWLDYLDYPLFPVFHH